MSAEPAVRLPAPSETAETPAPSAAEPAPAPAPSPVAAAAKPVLDTAKAEKQVPLAMLLKEAAEQSGKSLQQLVIDLAKLSFGPGKIAVEDFFAWRLFDDRGLSSEEMRRFASPRAFRPLVGEMNYNQHWVVATGHKLVSEAVLSGFGFPAARTRALYSDIATYPAFKTLLTKRDIRAYLTDTAHFPLFGKPVDGSMSLGTIGIDGYDGETDRLLLSNGRTVALDKLIDDITANYGSGYLFQDRLISHPDVVALCGNSVPTVRFYTLKTGGAPEVYRCVWKLPAGDSMADNFWRGNLLAALDPATGAITRVIRGTGLKMQELERHPTTGAMLIGARVPSFEATRDMVLAAAATYTEVQMIGWDVAPTERGGVIVEANDRPDFGLAQMADRRGILDERFMAAVAFGREMSKAMNDQQKNRKSDAKRKARAMALSGQVKG